MQHTGESSCFRCSQNIPYHLPVDTRSDTGVLRAAHNLKKREALTKHATETKKLKKELTNVTDRAALQKMT